MQTCFQAQTVLKAHGLRALHTIPHVMSRDVLPNAILVEVIIFVCQIFASFRTF